MERLSLPAWLPDEPDRLTVAEARAALLPDMKKRMAGIYPFRRQPETLRLLRHRHVIACLEAADDRDPLSPLVPVTGIEIHLQRGYDHVLDAYMDHHDVDHVFTPAETAAMINGLRDDARRKLADTLVWKLINTDISAQSITGVDADREGMTFYNNTIRDLLTECGDLLRSVHGDIREGRCAVR